MKYEYGGVEYEGDDFYCYPETKVLMNRLDIRKNYAPMTSLLEQIIVPYKKDS